VRHYIRILFVGMFALVAACATSTDVGTSQDGIAGTNQWNTNQWNTNQWNTNQWNTNQWNTNQWNTNGFPPNSLANNPTALPLMTKYPLKDTYNTQILTISNDVQYLRLQSEDPMAQWFMYYVVSCALPSTESITVWGQQIQGAMNLCPQWYSGAVDGDTRCQEAVSGCLVARNNAFGTRVNISFRGMPQSTFAVDQPAHDWSSTVQSYKACDTATGGYARNCGWTPDYTGVCLPGAQVTIGAGATPGNCTPGGLGSLGSSTGDTMLRVCAGTGGCDYGSADFVGTSDDTCPGSNTNPSLTFTCPAIGYFSAMTAPYYSTWPYTATAGATGLGVSYWAPESYAVPQDGYHSYEQLVNSAQACTQTTYGPARDCGWQTDYVGRCTPGQTVGVGMGGVPTVNGTCGATTVGRQLSAGNNVSTDGMLRVCDGLRACDFATAIGYDDDSCGTLSPYTTFKCPLSGTFSVMKAAYNSSNIVNGRVQALGGGSNYMAMETRVFNWQEGTFFGNMFIPGSMAAGVDIHTEVNPIHNADSKPYKVVNNSVDVVGSIYLDMYSCYSSNWTYGEAYLKNRICAGGNNDPWAGSPAAPTENCMATSVGACGAYPNPAVKTNNCKATDPAIDNQTDNIDCWGTNNDEYVYTPVTTYLNNPCDLVSQNGNLLNANPTLCLQQGDLNQPPPALP
jgi:hypothetical protein